MSHYSEHREPSPFSYAIVANRHLSDKKPKLGAIGDHCLTYALTHSPSPIGTGAEGEGGAYRGASLLAESSVAC